MEDFKELFKKYWIILVVVVAYFMFGTKKKRANTKRRSRMLYMRGRGIYNRMRRK